MIDRYFKVNKVNVRYGDIQVLWDIEFTVDKGEIIALVGNNGAGKSTTVKSCAGLLRPFRGNICLDGHDPVGAACKTFIGRGIIPVLKGRQLSPSMTIYENLEMGASSKAAKAAKKDTIGRVHNWFPRLKNRKDQLAGTLSGGEQRTLAFSRSVMGLPKLLIIDEPSPGLAPNIAGIIFSIAEEAAQEPGPTVILVEQDVKKALRIASRGYVIENGQITVSGTAEGFLDNDEAEKTCLGFQSVYGTEMKDGPHMG